MFQDELSGVRFVLTVVHIHLELISLSRRYNISTLFSTHQKVVVAFLTSSLGKMCDTLVTYCTEGAFVLNLSTD